MCSDPLDPGGEVRGSFEGCTIGMWDIAPLVFIVPAGRYIGCLELKMFFKRGCFRCGGIFWYSDWHKIVILFSATLHVILKVMPHTAHGRSLLQEAAAAEDASRAAVHVESSDTMHSQKAQCLAPPDNPETGDAYHSRGRSCACEKIKHQKNVYKRHSSSASTCVYRRGRFPHTRDLWRKRASMG